MDSSILSSLLVVRPPAFPEPADVMTVLVEVPPGGRGTPPHFHSGPVFGYVTEGELRYEIEGRPERVVRAGEPFWEPGGDVLHYQAANNLADAWTRLVAVMVCAPGSPMVRIATEEELERRAPRG